MQADPIPLLDLFDRALAKFAMECAFGDVEARRAAAEAVYSEVQAYAAAREAQARAEEREACAKLCDGAADAAWAWWKSRADPGDQGAAMKAEELASAIRARGEKT